MSPLIINEEKIFTFNFWFNGSVRCGLCHQGELYCRLELFPRHKRPYVYQLGCKLARQNATIILSSTIATCSLWGNLRDPSLKRLLMTVDASSLLDTMLLSQTDTLSNDRQTNE